MHIEMACCFGRSISAAVFLCAVLPAAAQSEKSKTASYVKVQAIAEKPDDKGRQTVSISLAIDEKYYLIGDRVSESLAPLQFRVRFIIKGKPVEAEVTYPAGKIEKDNLLGDYKIYEGKVVCKGVIRREPADASPIELEITMQGFPQHRST